MKDKKKDLPNVRVQQKGFYGMLFMRRTDQAW